MSLFCNVTELRHMHKPSPVPPTTVGSFLRPFANLVYDMFVGRWLWMLFRHGPLALGFWKGLSDQDICARIARNSETSDWVNPATGAVTSPCENMIDREFESFVVVVHSAIYVVTILLTVSALKQYCSTRLKTNAKTHAYTKAIHLSQLQLQLQEGRRRQGGMKPRHRLTSRGQGRHPDPKLGHPTPKPKPGPDSDSEPKLEPNPKPDAFGLEIEDLEEELEDVDGAKTMDGDKDADDDDCDSQTSQTSHEKDMGSSPSACSDTSSDGCFI